ncbi:MAG: glycosyltransferase [Candidatus Paceibacterota bacterium]|jgi:cellulose synthase/poly-beta-1,6-N-acetylglucosamine synthase-like glycosyltransferase
MSSEAFAYPFLFLTIFFESFLLITFLSTPARASRKRAASKKTPKVAIIVPCWDEETTVGGTIESLLALDYPREKLDLILVDDGSTDGTFAAMNRFAGNPQVMILQKENGGKHTAVNLGIAHAKDAELIGCLDADSFVEPQALREIIACFDEKEVMAATASMAVHQPRTILQRVQYIEYLLGIAMRHIFSITNSIYVTPGPFSFYRTQVFNEIGLFRHAHLTEDMEMALRMQRAGYRIENAIHARVYTKAPATLRKLFKQRVRWTTGFLRNVLYDYRDLIGNRRHGVLGLIILPISLISVVFGVFMFGTSVARAGQDLVHTIGTTSGIPFTYIVTNHSFGWFYLPYSTTFFLNGILVAIILSLIIMGKRVSRTPGRLMPDIVLYIFVYGLISPLWLITSVADVARGAKNMWR